MYLFKTLLLMAALLLLVSGPPAASQGLTTGDGASSTDCRSCGNARMPAHDQHRSPGKVNVGWIKQDPAELVPADEGATAIAIDATDGSIYITGYHVTCLHGEEWVTIKYDSSGKVRWRLEAPGENDGDDRPAALCLDAAGNVYITGWCWSDSSRDFLTIKYNREGVKQWEARYNNGKKKSGDEAVAIAVDAAGNLYVAGSGGGSGGGRDIICIKYDPNGREVWVNRYDGPNKTDDLVSQLVLDANGNVHLIGQSLAGNGYPDYVTIKYGATGEIKWVASYDGPGSGRDIATALAVDDTGNVLVTGRSFDKARADGFATIKYDSSGVEQWVARYNVGSKVIGVTTALALDGQGNVYVADRVGENYEVIGYDVTGNLKWFYRLNRSRSNWRPFTTMLALDGSGNLYLAGCKGGSDQVALFKLRKDDGLVWQALPLSNNFHEFEPAALALDARGNAYIAGRGFRWTNMIKHADMTVSKFDSSSKAMWTVDYAGIGRCKARATDLALDQAGNLYVTGRAHRLGTSWSCATIKYDRFGNQLWRIGQRVTMNRSNYPIRLRLDGAGNCYLTSTSVSVDSQYQNFFVIKYDAEGAGQWGRTFRGPAGTRRSQAFALACDADGNVCITGLAVRDSRTDYLTVRYTALGIYSWHAIYDGTHNEVAYHANDSPSALAMDDSGNVYVTGKSTGLSTGWDIATVKYNSAGQMVWWAQYRGEGSDDAASAIAVDRHGNIYLAGKSVRFGQPEEHLLLKYDRAGKLKWLQRRTAVRDFKDESLALALDQTPGGEALYLASTGDGASGAPLDYDYLIVKYDTAGFEQWTARYDGPAHSSDDATALTLDANGNVYVTGNSRGEDGSWDFATVKYDGHGTEQWVARYQGPLASDDLAIGVAVDSDDRVYVAGSSSKSTWSHYTIIQYLQDPTAVERDRQAAQQLDYSLQQNYPNPFNPATIIRYTLEAAGQVELKVFDLLGRELATLVNQVEPAGEHQVHWQPENLPAGIYVYRLRAGEFVAKRKLILLK